MKEHSLGVTAISSKLSGGHLACDRVDDPINKRYTVSWVRRRIVAISGVYLEGVESGALSKSSCSARDCVDG